MRPPRAEPVVLSWQPRAVRPPVRALDPVRRLVRAVRRWWRRERAIAELARLDDTMLADIGLHRSEIRSVVAEIDEPLRPSERRRSR